VGIAYDDLPEKVKRMVAESESREHIAPPPAPKASRPTQLEKELHKSVYNELYRRRPNIWFVDSRMDRPTTQRKGIPDFVCCINSKFAAIELKRRGEKPTDDQQRELNDISLAGGAYCVASSLEEVIRFINLLVSR
jgi:hypothetical protein